MRRLVVVAIAIWWLWPHRHTDVPVLQVATTSTGFVARVDGAIEVVDTDGKRLHSFDAHAPGEFRVVGARDGMLITGWKDGDQLLISARDADGELLDTKVWGDRVDHLCDGVASNEARWGIAWAERGGGVTVVNGPMEMLATTTAPKSWCGVASAGERIALLWRDSGRTLLNFCERQRCGAKPMTLPIDRDDQLIGFACADHACLFAVRSKRGTSLMRLTDRGQMLTRPLAHIGERVAITAVGSDAFAIAYHAEPDEAAYDRVALDGTRTALGSVATDQLPALTWAHGRLLVGWWHAGEARYVTEALR